MGRRSGIRWAALWVMVFAASSSVVAQTTSIVALSGQAAPDGDGAFESVMYPMLNNQGQVAFRAVLNGVRWMEGPLASFAPVGPLD